MTQSEQKLNPTKAKLSRARNSVRNILVTGIFWRILAIEMVLLVWSLAWRAWSTDSTAVELFWYAIRILILITIIIAFVTISLRSFLTRKIILPLEAVARANLNLNTEAPEVNPVPLPDETPDEIVEIVSTRQRMLKAILKVSSERLRLVDFIRDTFGRYLSKKVVDEILSSPEGHKIGGRRETVTILMADLRGFTRIAETQDPEQTVQLLNRFFDAMARIILSYDGMIDEFLGDGILTIFGVPERHSDDPARAVACALEMQNKIARLNDEIAAEGYPSLGMGIGINTGSVIVGNIGSEVRSKYGIVGRAVNIAARIESMTTEGQVFISEATQQQLDSSIIVDPPKTVMMKGLNQPLVCFPVKAISSPYQVKLNISDSKDRPVEIHLPLSCWAIADKQIVEPLLEGQTLTLGDDEMTFEIGHPIAPQTNVKIQLNFCTLAHCFEAIYAKVIESEQNGDHVVHRVRITSMDPKDRNTLQDWIAAAAP